MNLARSSFAAILLLGLAAAAQTPAAPASNAPVADALRNYMNTQGKNMIAAADEMPADKYVFKPTAESMPFGQLVLHIATSNESLCARISGAAPAPRTTLTATSPKDDLVTLLKQAFDYCNQSFAGLDDSKLGSAAGRGTQAASIVTLVEDLGDHYSQEAAYLRLNGLLPPTAQGGRGMGRMGGGRR